MRKKWVLGMVILVSLFIISSKCLAVPPQVETLELREGALAVEPYPYVFIPNPTFYWRHISDYEYAGGPIEFYRFELSRLRDILRLLKSIKMERLAA